MTTTNTLNAHDPGDASADDAGPTLVLVHGSPGEGRAWGNVLRQLPGGLRCLAPDLPGYGAAGPLPGDTPQRTAAMASAIAGLAARQPGPVWLCGHSYGANVALHAAVQLGSALAGLVLIEPVFLRALQLVDDERFEPARAHFMDYVRRAESSEPDAIGRMIDFWCGPGHFGRLPERARGFLNTLAPKNAVDVRATFDETLAAAKLQALDLPVLIATGDQSPPVAHAIAAACQRLMPGARTATIPGATHLLLDTHAVQVAALLQAQLVSGAQAPAEHPAR